MRVEVINTGTELLLGQVLNTHLKYLGERLFELELRVERQLCVPDGEAIRGAFEESFPRCEVVLATGGLGPTSDDLTREIVAELCGMPLDLDRAILGELEAFFATRGLSMSAENRRQAMVPRGARVLPNELGTAPGLYLPADAGRPHIFLLPGPPRELYPMFVAQVEPLLREIVGVKEERVCRNYKLFGVGESSVAERLEQKLGTFDGLEHGYCARPAEVDLRCIASEAVQIEIEALVREVYGEELISVDDATLPEVVVGRLQEKRETLAVAESCTGGLVAHLITGVSGASEVFIEGLVTYANEAKIRHLGVSEAMLEEHGAVSAAVAQRMAEQCRQRANATHALSVTGIAGPTGGTPEKPVGTVFIGLASAGEAVVVRRLFRPTDRATFQDVIARVALDMLRRRLGGIAVT